jgi:hypothetical protein
MLDKEGETADVILVRVCHDEQIDANGCCVLVCQCPQLLRNRRMTTRTKLIARMRPVNQDPYLA